MKDLSRKVALHCPVCGNTMFSLIDMKWENANSEAIPDDAEYKCSDCGKIVTKANLLSSNQRVLNANLEDVKKEALKEVKKEMKKIFR